MISSYESHPTSFSTGVDQLALLCVPCKYHGSEEPSSGSGAVRVCVSRDADVSALRAAVAAQLEPKTSGFGPWRQTLSAEPGQIHFFVSGGSDGTELVPVTEGVAQIAQQSSNEVENSSCLVYFTVESVYGDDICCCFDAFDFFCNDCCCCICCIPCCCCPSENDNHNNQGNGNSNITNQSPVQAEPQTNQYNYYNGPPPDQPGYYGPPPDINNYNRPCEGYAGNPNPNPYNGPQQPGYIGKCQW